MSSTRLVIFDCDGVLVDSEALVMHVESRLLTEAGFPVTAREIADEYVGLNAAGMRSKLEARFGRPVPESVGREIQNHVLQMFSTRLRGVPGIDELLAGLTLPRGLAKYSAPDGRTAAAGFPSRKVRAPWKRGAG